VLADAKAATVTGFIERALARFAEHGIHPRRLMSGNACGNKPHSSLEGRPPISRVPNVCRQDR
jgi:hypothetical protein